MYVKTKAQVKVEVKKKLQNFLSSQFLSPELSLFFVLNFEHLDLVLVSDFLFRASNLNLANIDCIIL